MGEILFMIIIAIAAIIMFIMTYDFPVSIIDKSGGAALFPRIIIILLLFFMLIRLISILRTKKEERKPFAFTEMFKGSRLVYLLLTIAYIAVLTQLGFIISSLLYLFILINYFYYLQNGRLPAVKTEMIIVISIVAGVLILNYFFGNVLNILLPKGILK